MDDAAPRRRQVPLSDAAVVRSSAVTQSRAVTGIDDDSGLRTGPYHFGFAGRLSQQRVATVAAAHETFARMAAESLAGQTRAQVEILPSSVVQLTGDEFHAALPRAAVLAGVALDPLGGVALLAVDQRVAYALLDRLLGGRGAASVPARELSEIEHSVLQNSIAGLLPHLQAAWEPIAGIRPRLEYCARHDQAPALVPAGMLVRIAFAASIGKVEGELQVAIPCLTLNSIRDRGAARHYLARREAQPAGGRRAAVQEALQGVRVSVTAELGSALLPLPRVLALRKGDLIRLDAGASGNELYLKVAGRPKFRCRPGVVGRRLAVQVVAPLTGEAEAAQ